MANKSCDFVKGYVDYLLERFYKDLPFSANRINKILACYDKGIVGADEAIWMIAKTSHREE